MYRFPDAGRIDRWQWKPDLKLFELFVFTPFRRLYLAGKTYPKIGPNCGETGVSAGFWANNCLFFRNLAPW